MFSFKPNLLLSKIKQGLIRHIKNQINNYKLIFRFNKMNKDDNNENDENVRFAMLLSKPPNFSFESTSECYTQNASIQDRSRKKCSTPVKPDYNLLNIPAKDSKIMETINLKTFGKSEKSNFVRFYVNKPGLLKQFVENFLQKENEAGRSGEYNILLPGIPKKSLKILF